jgi:hypothetical protein
MKTINHFAFVCVTLGFFCNLAFAQGNTSAPVEQGSGGNPTTLKNVANPYCSMTPASINLSTPTPIEIIAANCPAKTAGQRLNIKGATPSGIQIQSCDPFLVKTDITRNSRPDRSNAAAQRCSIKGGLPRWGYSIEISKTPADMDLEVIPKIKNQKFWTRKL